MQVEVTTVLGFLGTTAGTLISIYLAMFRYALAQKEAEFERRFTDIENAADERKVRCEEDMRSLDNRITVEEKCTIQLTGDINLVRNNHDSLNKDLEEIKRTMITKAEFEPRMTNLERTLNQILSELRGGGSRYSSHSSIPVVTGPKR